MTTPKRLRFYDRQPEIISFQDEVMRGLNKKPRALPPKFFYDETGSRLFDAICETPEYYPTRSEVSILQNNIDDIAEHIGSDCVLIEPGSGNSRKVRLLLEEIRPHVYVPMDISGDYLLEVARQLVDDYPSLNVHAACADYTAPLEIPVLEQARRKIAFFPGSTIGNFEPSQATNFLTYLKELVGKNGGLLIGVDLKKNTDILNAAYNDSEGITAQFNLNLLTRINNELGADFNIDKFSHCAFYNEMKGRIEMHLVSNIIQKVRIKGAQFNFTTGETIHTENSYKYTIPEFQTLAKQAGFTLKQVWTDENGLFSVHFYHSG